MTQENDGGVAIPMVWVANEDVPILFANQFVIQHEHDEFLLTVGQLQPPIILGTPEERAEQVKMISYVPVNMVARIGFNRDRGNKRGLTSWYNLYLQPMETESAVGPMAKYAMITLLAELGLIFFVRIRYKGKS